MRTVPLGDARAKFGDLARLAGEMTMITRYGRRVAAIVPFREFDVTAPDGPANVQPEDQDER